MHGYDASRAGPVDYGYAGHGHGAGQHDEQQQYQSTNTQWGEPQQGHGNGYIDYGKHQQIGYTSYQQPHYRAAGPSASSSSSLPFSQPRADHAGIYAQRQQYPQQQQQQAHQYNQQYDLPYNQNAGGSSTQPNYQPSARPPDNQRTASSLSSSNVGHYPASSVSRYQSGSAGVEASPRYPESRDQRRLPSKSPTLPALNTSTSVNTSGFGSLFQQQLEAEIDEIQAKHTPVSSPSSGSFPNLNLTPQPGRPTVSSNNSDMRHVPMRNDSANTVTGDSLIDPSGYGGSGIISMYDPRIPSPIPSDDAQSAHPAGFSQHHSSAASRYQPPHSQYQQSSRSTSMQNSMPQTTQYQSAPASNSNRQPTTPAYERQRRPSAPDRTYRSASGATSEYSSHSAAVPLSHSMGSVRPLPSSPSTSSHAHSSQSSVRNGRPSQESNISSYSSSSRAAFPAGGTVAPRPSMSSSLASRPSLNFSEGSHSRQHVRPLPVPNASNEETEQLRSGYVDSPDAYETLPPIRELARSERSRQSDFTKDFYAAGSTLPDNYVKQHATSTPRPPPPSNTGRHPAADRYRLQSHHSQQPNEHHQYPQAYRAQTSAPIISPSISSLSGASISSTATLSSSPAPLGQGHGFPHPPIVHSYSDPSADSRSSSSSSRARQNSGQALPMSSSRTAKSSASRSASFSNAGAATAAKERSDYSTRRNVSMGNRSNSKMSSQHQIPESSPPLPSSPSISISTTFNDASFSSTYSTLSTAPSQSTYTSAMRKQPSLSPSNMSLSAGGFLSTKNGRDTDRERRRMEGLGLQHLNPALLSNLAVAFKDRIPRTLNVKGSVHYPSSFTGEQVVSCLAEILPFPYTDNRGIAIAIARNLHRNMFFNEVDWDDARQLRDSQEQVFCFQDDEEQATFDYLTGNTAGGSVYSPAARAPDSASKTQEIPNGVITRFTKCYSPFCGMEGTAGSGACYSLYCPNGAHPLGLQRKQSALSLAPSSTTEEQAPPEAWASTVPADLIEQLGPKEVARQNVIFEIVTGEQAYKKDLDMLETAYAEPLRSANPPVIEPNRLTSFANQVFANLDELRAHSGRLVNAFQVRQREQNPVVESIGDLVLDAALEWGQAYMDFAEAQVMGEYLVNEEKTTNSAFATFLQSRREAFGIKQDFRHYHLRATIRLQRYLLPLAEYIKRCPDDHPDRETTQEAMRIIRQQCDACNAAVADAQLRLACIRYDKLLERDFHYVNDLDLLHPSRQLFHHGRMYAKPEGARSEWTEYQVMVFDHYLVIAKPRRIVEGYRLIRKPIRLEMFSTTGWDDPPTIRSSGFHLSNVIRTGERREASTSNHAGDKPESKMWPIAFRISGRTSGILTLFVETPKNDKDGHARKEWKSKLEQAIAVQKAVMDANQVFQLKMLMDPDLRRTPATSVHGVASMGKVLASCPFTGPTGQRLVAVGTSTGLYIALKHDPTTLRQILQISTQYCAVLQDFGMFLVHTEGRLLSYLLETLVQTSSSESKGQQGPQQVSGQKDILFFKVGRVGPRTLVVYAKKDGVNSTVLKAMEPVANIERSRVQHSRFLGMGGKKTEWFRLFKDAAVPTEVYNLSFTRSKLALVCAPGFEILDIDTLKTGSFPDWTAIKTDPTKFDAATAMLQRRCLESRAIGLFRISDSEFLFCYEDFAFFADRHGDPLRARFGDMIEWEGRPDTVVYCRPYVLAFDTRFIEVRDTSRRGKLVQIIRGNNIRCTYDGQGLPSSGMEVRMAGSVEAEERLPHFVMRENNVDRLYELAPRA